MTTIDFVSDEAGAPPKGWTLTMTGRGTPKWTVEKDDTSPSKGQVLKPLDIIGRKGGYGVKIAVPANQWHTLRVTFSGTRFKVTFNGEPLFEVEDATFAEPGMVGLWTNADSVTSFCAFTYGENK